MAVSNYAFVRDVRNAPNIADIQKSGWTPLIAFDDPNAQSYAQQLQNAGINFGLWGDPTHLSSADPSAFAQTLATYARNYGANTIVPDVEFIGKGNPGSQGYTYDQQLANALKQYAGGLNIALTPMGNQHDFNYGAFKGIVNQWLPQAYGANPSTDVYDPKQIAQVLIDEGVDPSIITPVLGVGNDIQGFNSPYALFTADDFVARGLPTVGQSAPTGTRMVANSNGSPSPSTAPPPAPRLSQSAATIAANGLKWGGQTFQSPQQLRAFLGSHGGSYATWAQNHPTAATALAAKIVAPTARAK